MKLPLTLPDTMYSWTEEFNATLGSTPSFLPYGSDLPGQDWLTLNYFRDGVVLFNACVVGWSVKFVPEMGGCCADAYIIFNGPSVLPSMRWLTSFIWTINEVPWQTTSLLISSYKQCNVRKLFQRLDSSHNSLQLLRLSCF